MENVLITGATGLVATNLMPCLIGLGYQVLGTTRGQSAANIFQCDLNNYNQVRAYMGLVKPDVVVHLAGNSKGQPPEESQSRWELIEDNTRSTFNILEACRNLKIKPYILFASSIVVYGDPCKSPEGPTEYSQTNPRSLYGVSKLASEKLLNSYAVECGIPSTSIRFPALVGPNLTHGIVKILLGRLRTDGPLTALGTTKGGSVKPYCHTDDVCELISCLINSWKTTGKFIPTINLSNNPLSILEVANTIMDAIGIHKDILWEDKNWPTDDQYLHASNNQGLFNLIGFNKKYSSEEAIRKACNGTTN